MAEVKGFRGLRYDLSKVGRADGVVCPPYDVIDDALQRTLYARSPYNAVRVEFGGTAPGDDERDNRYTRAGATLREWVARGVLRQDPEPSLYLCEEDYRGEFGESVTRRGFFAAVRLEDPGSGVYHPHERTLAGPKEDRLRLVRACRANLSPIFSLYDDPDEAVEALLLAARGDGAPTLSVRSDDGVAVRLWRVSDPELLHRVARAMADQPFFIADGHHRYETALRYRDEQRVRHPDAGPDAPWNHVMMYLSNMSSPGLTVFPTHRAVFGLPSFDPDGFLGALTRWFRVASVASDAELVERLRALRGRSHAYGLVLPGGHPPRLLELADESVLDGPVFDGMPGPVRHLEVTILHTLILESVLGVDRDAQARQVNLRYVKGHDALFEVVREDPGVQCGFVMNPTPVHRVKEVSLLGERMPQKSTYFYPKMMTGLVMRLLDERIVPAR